MVREESGGLCVGVCGRGSEEVYFIFIYDLWFKFRDMVLFNCKEIWEMWFICVYRGKGSGFGEFLFNLYLVEYLVCVIYLIIVECLFGLRF